AVLAVAARYRVPFLLASTSEVYGRSQRKAFAEKDDLLIGPPTIPRWSYACSKLMDEFLTCAFGKEHGLPIVVARIFNTVGPRQTGAYGMVMPRFIEAAKNGRLLQVYGRGNQSRCFCYVEQTVEALLRLMPHASAAGPIVNVGGAEEITLRALADLVIKTLGSKSRVKFVSYERAYGPAFEDMPRRKPVLTKLRRLTALKTAMPVEEMIKRIAALGCG
ncbi:MAG TPA: NAD-dependent epimerase/dehydratase family protein, partial [Verrucomicrobiae bacterium]|nr:NAD-dependent epimerase/dehydratase family protein [Verrucomicrobiae bacterium]